MIPPNSSFLKPPNSIIIKIPVLIRAPQPSFCFKTASFWAQGADWGRMGSGCCVVWAKKKKMKPQIVESKGFGNGVDVMDASMAEPRVSPQHLIIMVNGLIGSASDWKFAADQFVKQLPDKVIVHCSQCNPAKLTFDGVDMMGERLADEVLTVIRQRPDLQKISFVAHSLGGLVARYAIGRLYDYPRKVDPLYANGDCLVKANPIHIEGNYKEDCGGRIAGLEMMNFITVATPHLGSRGHKQLPFLCGLPFLEKQAKETAHLVAGRSGKHLFLTDNDEGRPPLLVRMVSDSYELKFISALSSFKRRVAYANVSFDHVVGWSTSSIRRLSELPKANLLVKDGSYDHIVYNEQQTSDDVHHKKSYIESQTVDLEEEMVRGLNQVPWERVDVSFHQSRQRYIAHNTIQVQDSFSIKDVWDGKNVNTDNVSKWVASKMNFVASCIGVTYDGHEDEVDRLLSRLNNNNLASEPSVLRTPSVSRKQRELRRLESGVNYEKASSSTSGKLVRFD